MGNIRILYFLEDRAQEGFIKALVKRIATEESVSSDNLIHDIRSARGRYRIIKEFRNFIKETALTGQLEADLLILAKDGNCKGHQESIRELNKYFQTNHPLKDKTVYAVPDPHIERWYIIDQRAFRDGVGLERAPDMPPYKCEKAYYKQILHQALKNSNIGSLLSGAEYAEKIVENIQNFELLGNQNAGFQNFIEGLRRFFKSKRR